MFSKNPEAPLQARLAQIEWEEKNIKADTDARLNSLAAEKQNLHVQVRVIRDQKQELARAKVLELVKPIDLRLATLRDKQRQLQESRQWDAANALVQQVSELYRQRRLIVA